MNNAGLLLWLEHKRQSDDLAFTEISFQDSQEWAFENGALVHRTGGFFAIEGVKASWTQKADSSQKQQPIINQPEIGILGFLVARTEQGYQWLVQAKSEPGNVCRTQVALTVQATYSNYSQAHMI